MRVAPIYVTFDSGDKRRQMSESQVAGSSTLAGIETKKAETNASIRSNTIRKRSRLGMCLI